MRPSLSESYMWNRTGGGGERRMSQARMRREPRVPRSPNLELSKAPQQCNPNAKAVGGKGKGRGARRTTSGG